MEPIQCVVLAGGLATRMRPLTEKIPKAMIPVAGEPFISHQLKWLRANGVTDVVLSLGFLGEQVEEYVGDGKKWGIRVECVMEGPKLLGTAGALRLALDRGLLKPTFMVTYGDSFLPINYSTFYHAFLAQRLPAMMSVYRNQGKWDASNVWYAEGRVHLYDKKHRHPEHEPKLLYIDYGLSAMQSSIVHEMVPTGQVSDLAELFYALSRDALLSGFEVNTRFYEIGSPQGLTDFSDYVSSQSAFNSARDHLDS